jgi:transcriptional regulator with XRE-family HTH domain
MSSPNPEAILAALIELFKAEREAQNLNYEELASGTGLHRTTLGLYERGERGPTVEAALLIAAALDVPLSVLLRRAEERTKADCLSEVYYKRRDVPVANLRNAVKLRQTIGLQPESIRDAILNCYKTLDTIDEQLIANGGEPIAKLVELANLSSMICNLLGSGIAKASNGLYLRNRSHAYPDLIPQNTIYDNLELKVALEKNKPKGHLPKAGNYITFRYVLCDGQGDHKKGKDSRGTKVFIWEVKCGAVRTEDFDISNTAGDSGKTAVIKTTIFNRMHLVYYDKDLLPYAGNGDEYPGFN